jgi:hypothetical protein
VTFILLAAVFACDLLTLYAVHRMLRAHHEVMARVIGRRARDIADELSHAEERISEAARTGLRARNGPARLRDQDSGNSGTTLIPGGSA